MTGFVMLPRRWLVERIFSWFGRNRRLAKDRENLADTLFALVILASIQPPSANSRVGRILSEAPRVRTVRGDWVWLWLPPGYPTLLLPENHL